MPEKVSVVLIGCGDIALSGHLPALRRSQEVDLTGVVDSDDGRAEAAARRFETERIADLEMAWQRGARAVVLATPPTVSPALTFEAIALGMDVLCEKPMAVDFAVAQKVAQATAASVQVVQIGFKNRFSPLVRAVRRWIETGKLGSPVAFTVGGFDEAYDPNNLEHTNRISHFLQEAPAFVHDGAHYADYLAYLTASTPVRIRATGITSRSALPSENFVSALVDYSNGDVARLEIGWQFPTSPRGEFRALGPEGVALLDRPNGTATLLSRTGNETVTLDRTWNDVCFDAQLEHFVACVRTRAEPETSVRAGLDSLRLGLAATEAMRSGDTVSWA